MRHSVNLTCFLYRFSHLRSVGLDIPQLRQTKPAFGFSRKVEPTESFTNFIVRSSGLY